MDSLGEFVYKRTYARYLPDEGRREEWHETVNRYCDWAFRNPLIPTKVKVKSKEKLLKQQVMCSMRAAWTAGKAADLDNAVIYNCAYLNVEDLSAFGTVLYLLMCGTGVGYSVEQKHIDNLPVVEYQKNRNTYTHVVDDSRLGWKVALDKGIEAWWHGRDITFDFSCLRPLGAPLKTSGGRSSGGEVLRDLLQYARELVFSCQGRKISSLEAHNLMCQVAAIVVVGGTRRSALISLSDLNDQELRNCKKGVFHPRLYGANNSATYYNKPDMLTFLDEWVALAKSGSGERGIANLWSARKNAPSRRKGKLIEGMNPCFRGDMRLLTVDGYKTFKELANQKAVALINKDGDISTGKVWANPVLQEVIEVRFDDDDSYNSSIYCTAEHRFMLADGTECEAQHLTHKRVKWYSNDFPEGRLVRGVWASKTVDVVYDFSEPLINWGVVEGAIVHNCGEVTLRNREFCNLVEVVVRPEDDFESLRDKVTTAAWLGTIQSTFDYFPALHEDWHNNAEEERLVGISLSGQMDNPGLLSDEVLRLLKQHATNTCRKASKTLNINMPASCTTVKPAGTTSQLVNSSAGIHPRYAPYYIRNIMIATSDPLFALMRDQGAPIFYPKANGESTAVIQFPVASPKGAITRHDMSALDQLEWYYKNVTSWTDMNASATVYVDENEWLAVANWVYNHFDKVNGLTFFPKMEDNTVYEWTPFQEIGQSEYEDLAEKFPTIDYSQLSRYENNDQTTGAKEFACSNGSCSL